MHPIGVGVGLSTNAAAKKKTEIVAGSPLLEREKIALALTKHGLQAKQIAGHMERSDKSVEAYLADARRRLEVHTSKEAVEKAIQSGQLTTELLEQLKPIADAILNPVQAET